MRRAAPRAPSSSRKSVFSHLSGRICSRIFAKLAEYARGFGETYVKITCFTIMDFLKLGEPRSSGEVAEYAREQFFESREHIQPRHEAEYARSLAEYTRRWPNMLVVGRICSRPNMLAESCLHVFLIWGWFSSYFSLLQSLFFTQNDRCSTILTKCCRNPQVLTHIIDSHRSVRSS